MRPYNATDAEYGLALVESAAAAAKYAELSALDLDYKFDAMISIC